jgi:hypothetical protein
VTDELNDKTYEKYNELIPIPTVRCPYHKSYEYLKNLVDSKNKYEEIIDGTVELDSYTEEEIAEFLDFLSVEDFSQKILHTIILFDDATEMFRSKSDPLRNFLLRNRHHKFTVFLNVHSYTGDVIRPIVKKNLGSLWFFGGYNEQDFGYSYRQFNSPINKPELWERYRTLTKRDVLFFDYQDGGAKVKIIKLG